MKNKNRTHITSLIVTLMTTKPLRWQYKHNKLRRESSSTVIVDTELGTIAFYLYIVIRWIVSLQSSTFVFSMGGRWCVRCALLLFQDDLLESTDFYVLFLAIPLLFLFLLDSSNTSFERDYPFLFLSPAERKHQFDGVCCRFVCLEVHRRCVAFAHTLTATLFIVLDCRSFRSHAYFKESVALFSLFLSSADLLLFQSCIVFQFQQQIDTNSHLESKVRYSFPCLSYPAKLSTPSLTHTCLFLVFF